MSIDWGAAEQSFWNGLLWGIGFAIPLFVGLPWAIMRILSHPTIVKGTRALDRLAGKDQGWLGQVIGIGRDLLIPKEPPK